MKHLLPQGSGLGVRWPAAPINDVSGYRMLERQEQKKVQRRNYS